MSSLSTDIGLWMHYRAKEIKDTDQLVVIFEDHRGVIPVAAAAGMEELFKYRPSLFRLDAHTDYGRGERVDPPIWSNNLSCLKTYCDDCVQKDDGTWLEAAENLNLLCSSATWFIDPEAAESSGHELNKCYSLTDATGSKHRNWFTGGFANFIEAYFKEEEWARKLAKYLCIFEEEKTLRCNPGGDMWLDIDLDFCMTDGKVWSQEAFNAEFGENPAGEFWRSLVESAKLITIATEPQFTKGLGNGAKILEMLKGSCETPQIFEW